MVYPAGGYSPNYSEYSIFPGAAGGAQGAASPFPPGVMPTTGVLQNAYASYQGGGVGGGAGAAPPQEHKGFFSKLGSAVKGVVKGATVNLAKTIGGIVTDPKKLLLTAGAIGACFIPGIGPVIGAGLMTYGLSKAAGSVVQGAGVAAEGWKTDNTDLIEKGFADIGTGVAVGGLSVAGIRASVAARGVTPKGFGVMQSGKLAVSDAKTFAAGVKTNGVSSTLQTLKTGTANNFNQVVVQPFKAAKTAPAQTADDIAAQTAQVADDVAAQTGQVAGEAANASTTSSIIPAAIRDRLPGGSNPFATPSLQGARQGTIDGLNGIGNVATKLNRRVVQNSQGQVTTNTVGLLPALPGINGPYSEVQQLIQQQQQMYAAQGGHV